MRHNNFSTVKKSEADWALEHDMKSRT